MRPRWFWGRVEHFKITGGEPRFFDAVYSALLAFVGFDDYVSPPNWQTQIARFTGLAVIGYAILGIVTILLRDQAKRVMAGWRKHHQIVIGASDFALDYAVRQGRVTVFDTADHLDRLTAQGKGALLLPDEMNNRTARGPSAGRSPKTVIFGAPDSVMNVERARLFLSQTPQKTYQRTQFVLRIEDNSVARDLDLLGSQFAQVTVISRSEMIARALVTGMAPTYLALLRGHARVHVVLLGLDRYP